MISEYSSRQSIPSGKFLSVPGIVQTQQLPKLDEVIFEEHQQRSSLRQIISFTDPKIYQKCDQLESFEEGNQGSKQSFNFLQENQQKSLGSSRVSPNNKVQFSVDNKSVIQSNQFSSEIEWLISQGRKEISQKLRKENPVLKAQDDSFSLSPQLSNDQIQENFFDNATLRNQKYSSKTYGGNKKSEDQMKFRNPSLKNDISSIYDSKHFLNSRKNVIEVQQLQEEQNDHPVIIGSSRGNQQKIEKIKTTLKTKFLIATKFLAATLGRKNIFGEQKKLKNFDFLSQMHLCVIGDKASDYQDNMETLNSLRISLLQYSLTNNFEIGRSIVLILVYLYSIYSAPVYDLMRTQKYYPLHWEMFSK